MPQLHVWDILYSFLMSVLLFAVFLYTIDSRYLEVQGTLNYFEISVPRRIRFPEVRYIENIVEKRRNCSLGAISLLYRSILVPVVRFLCLNRDQIFTSR